MIRGARDKHRPPALVAAMFEDGLHQIAKQVRALSHSKSCSDIDIGPGCGGQRERPLLRTYVQLDQS